MRPEARTILIALSTLLVVVAAGCGGTDVEIGEPNQQQNDTDNSDTDNDNQNNQTNNVTNNGEDNYSQEASDLADSYCDRVFECCTGDEHGYQDEDHCNESSVGNLFGLTGDELVDAQESGTVDVDDDSFPACRDNIGEMSCQEFDGTVRQRQELEGCRDVITPQQHSGDSCQRDWECISGFCGSDETCENFAQEGESCQERFCEEGTYCDDDECVSKLENGQDCNHDDHCLSGNCADQDPDSDITVDSQCEETAPRCEG